MIFAKAVSEVVSTQVIDDAGALTSDSHTIVMRLRAFEHVPQAESHPTAGPADGSGATTAADPHGSLTDDEETVDG